MTTQVGASPERVGTCAECGSRVQPGEPFCEACGAVLSWAAANGAPGTDRSRPAVAGEPGGRPAAPTGTTGGSAGATHALPAQPAATSSTGGGHGATDSTGEQRGPAAGSSPDAVPGSGGEPHARDTAAVGSSPDSDSGLDSGSGGASDAGSATGPRGDDHDPAGEGRPRDSGAAAPPTAAPPAADAGTPTPRVPAVPGESRSSTADAAARARSLLVPVADAEPRPTVTPTVAPVLPGRPVARPAPVRAPGQEQGADGGVPCPWCSTRNRPERHFCARCAMPMTGDRQNAARSPWWRRLLNRRDRPAPWAGDRPRLRRGFGRIGNWLAGGVVLALVVTAVVHADTAAGAVRDHFAKRAPVAPDSVRASRSYAGHGVRLAFDKLNNTWWGPGVSQSGQGQWVEARFQEPTRLLDVVITPGVSTRPDQLSKSAQPHRIEALITTADGKKVTRPIVLDQGSGGQRRTFTVGSVTSVRFVLQSSYGVADDKQPAIAEIEFFGPSHGRS
ncbi:NADase-type glycan-binding domain-containing protein [Streptomyces cellulosae]|uniref:NADase-type glycan-binding domain-containing protein n=1 Tax=Streptomyces cellulosae TaxID=1968 RepID=UPI0004C77175|nr:zinc ribbon domain-containing protein [Streptomyces cellulosae]